MSVGVVVKPARKRLRIPRLKDGDELSADEYMRRYEAMPDGFRAELIEGVVYVASPVRADVHGRPESNLRYCLSHYRVNTPHLEDFGEITVRMDEKNNPEPDLMLRLDPEHGGKSTIDNQGYLVGSPELIAEISASTTSIDRGKKYRVYLRNGVQEYIIWRVEMGAIDWFQLDAGDYVPLQPNAKGVVKSGVFPGLWIDVPGLLAGNMKQVVATVNRGLKSADHRTFVARIASKRRFKK